MSCKSLQLVPNKKNIKEMSKIIYMEWNKGFLRITPELMESSEHSKDNCNIQKEGFLNLLALEPEGKQHYH